MPTTPKHTDIHGDELAELDFVAFLAALGFPILSRRRVRRYDLAEGMDEKLLGLWTVGVASSDNKYRLADIRARWAHGVPDRPRTGMERDVVAVTRLVMHNFRALTQLGKHGRHGCELYAVPLGTMQRLNNERSFADARPVAAMTSTALAAAPASVGTFVAAVAITHGCPILGYSPATSAEGRAYLRWHLGAAPASMPSLAALAALWRDEKWLLDPQNDSPLAVAMMTLKNRKMLLADTFAPKELTLLSQMARVAGGAEGNIALVDADNQRQIDRACQSLGI